MNRCVVAWFLSLSCLVPAAPASAELDRTRFMPVEEVRAGQQGYALSVFQGTTPDTFEIEILGVLENIGPGRDLILGRARGEFLEYTGIIAGMSGSPVYVEGRLIGAMAYAWTFAKEPITGITPIAEMLGMLNRERPGRPTGRLDVSPERIRVALGDTDEHGAVSEARPIQTPVVLSGFPGPARRVSQRMFGSLGFLGVEGGGRAPKNADFEISAGRALGIELVRGDMSSTAIGTVTWVDGERVLAFGHPLLLAGPVSIPMVAAYIHTVLPSQASSFKIGAPGERAGAILEDRQAGVFGRMGVDASMLPVSVTVTSGEGYGEREYRFEVVRSDLLAPSLVGLVSYSSVAASEKALGESTLDIRTRVNIDGERTVESEVAVASGMPPAAVTEQIGWPIQTLMENPFEDIEIQDIHVDVRVVDRVQLATIDGLRVDRHRVHPGESLDVWITLRVYRTPEVVRRVTLDIPADAPEGRLEILACSSGDLWDIESERAPLRFEPTRFDQLLELLESRRSTRSVYLQLFHYRGGKVVEGEEFPRLPGSVLSVMSSGMRSGQTGSSAGAVLADMEIETEWVVVGSRSVTVDVTSSGGNP